MFKINFTIIIFLLGIIASISTIIYLFKKKPFKNYKLAIILFIGFILWIAGYGLEILSIFFKLKLLFSKLEYLGIVCIPVAFFLLTLDFSGYREDFTIKEKILISIIPALTLIFASTNEFHKLIWSAINENVSFGAPMEIIKYGLFFWIWTFYSYFLLLISYFFLIKTYLIKFKIFKLQSLTLIIALTIPFIINALYIFKISKIFYYDPTPIALVFSSFVLLYGIIKLKIGNIIPFIYNNDVENLNGSVIVINTNDKILYINDAAKEIFGENYQGLVGKDLKLIWNDYFNYKEDLINNFGTFELKNIIKNNPENYYKIYIKPNLNKKKEILNIEIIFENVTEKRLLENKIKESEERFKNVFNSSPIGIIILNSDGYIIDANKTALDILGIYSINDIEKLNFFNLFNLPSDFKNKLNENQHIRYEVKLKFKKLLHKFSFKSYKKGIIFLDILISLLNIPNIKDSEGYLLYIQDITERKEDENRIIYLSFHDGLTNLYNRSFFEEEIKRLDVERQFPISIVVVDINGLKLVNDTYGHSYGDILLKKTTQKLIECFRKEDIIARWGGDEFIVLLSRTPAEVAFDIINRVKSICDKEKVFNIPLNISIGVSSKVNESQDINDVIKEAESNMIKNKLITKESAHNAIIVSLEKALEERDYETSEHIKRMKNFSLKIGKFLNLSENELNELSLVATLHDIGKIAIPDNILKKPDKLSSEEWEIIKKHPEIGYRIASSSVELKAIAEAILAHHERWDGKGYPRGLKGDQIPLVSRIIAIIDSFDAMISDRPYRKAMSINEAKSELIKCSGSQFDPEIIKKFIIILDEEKTLLKG